MPDHPTIEERHAALAESVQFLFHAQLRTEETLRQFEQAQLRWNEESKRENDAAHRNLEGILRRAIRLSVREARAERVKRKQSTAKIDEEMAKLAAAQRVTEEKLQTFIEWTQRRNGHSPSA
jgi:hypothetical protein